MTEGRTGMIDRMTQRLGPLRHSLTSTPPPPPPTPDLRVLKSVSRMILIPIIAFVAASVALLGGPIPMANADGGVSIRAEGSSGPTYYVGEGGVTNFSIRLTVPSPSQVDATASITAGTSHASITAGSSLSFAAGTSAAQNVSLMGTEDSVTNELDTVELTLTFTSADTAYDGLTVTRRVFVVDNDVPITLRLSHAGVVSVPESGSQTVTVRVSASRRVHTRVWPQLTLAAGSTGSFSQQSDLNGSTGLLYDPIPVGETQGSILISTYDDDVVEQDATATATLALATPIAGIAVDPGATFTLFHQDDDHQIVDIQRLGSGDGETFDLYFARQQDFPLTVHLLAKDPNDVDQTLNHPGTNHARYSLGDDLSDYRAIVIQTPASFTMNRQWVDLTDSNLMSVIAHGDSPPKPQTCTPTLPYDAITVSEVEAWRDAHSHDAAHVKRWNRVLAALGESTGETPLSADESRDNEDTFMRSRWDRVTRTLEALEQCTGSTDTTPAATPEISITGGSGITEGGNASFTVTANPAPASDLDVTVAVTQSGDYGVSTGSQTVTIPTGGSYTLTVATTDDSVDEADGSVTVMVSSGTGYTVSATAGSATVAVADDDAAPPATPEISIIGGSGVTEGGDATFTLTANPAPHAPLSVSVAVSQSGDFGVTTGSQTVSIPTTGSYTLTVATVNDSVDEANGSVTVTLNAGTGYDVSSSNSAATVAISDDDDPPKPVNATPSLSISDGSASEGGAITFTVTLSSSSSRYVWVHYYARPAFGAAASATFADFEGTYGLLTFNPGETLKTITVALVDDSLVEGDETFVVVLYSATQAKISDGEAVGTIVDND